MEGKTGARPVFWAQGMAGLPIPSCTDRECGGDYIARQLLCRNHSNDVRKRDVAGASIITRREDAHKFARLYFRPLTPTQYHIEGIKRRDDEYIDQGAHAPVLVMFLFDSGAVLTRPGTHFSNGNMQRGDSRFSEDEGFFRTIDFAKVYHNVAYDEGADGDIKFYRSAEVLAESPLPLRSHLRHIYCRSQAERRMLLYMVAEVCGPEKLSELRAIIEVSDDTLLFQKRYSYVDTTSLDSKGVVWRLNPRRDGQPSEIEIHVYDRRGRLLHRYGPTQKAPFHESGRPWRWHLNLRPGGYRVEIQIEGCLAYNNVFVLEDDVPF